ncbi:MAG: F0F1 ATP synthase subunit alpha [Myxococcales bacterium]|nr:F0F1 ATP synthase subunit alpha [Myxococcales bacterium]
MTVDATALARALAAQEALDLAAAFRLRGVVAQVGDGVARVLGLDSVGSEELVVFDSGAYGMAYDVAATYTGVVLLTDSDRVRVGQGVSPVGTLPQITAGRELLGRVVDPFGQPLDDLPAPRGALRSVFADAPELAARASVTRPLHTGVMAIDAAIPIGRGQRQLILGDRNVGKTALALDIVVAQRTRDIKCVYVVIGQPLSRVLAIRAALRESDALRYTVVIAADAADAPAMQYLAPYAAMAVAERFREDGDDAIVVLDDLTKHADAYRELALLLGRPPGREAFPGDIFYIHGQLLERASAFNDAAGGGSITVFPIAETTDNDISAYIPTNLISITDGQIYLDTARFERNLRPAIDIGKSVSRIGGVAQPAVMRAAAKNVRIDIARFESLETLTRVGLDVDAKTRATLDRGRTLRELLRQPRVSPRSIADQVLTLTAVLEGWIDGLRPEQARATMEQAIARSWAEAGDVMRALDQDERVDDDARARLRALVEAVRREREGGDA